MLYDALVAESRRNGSLDAASPAALDRACVGSATAMATAGGGLVFSDAACDVDLVLSMASSATDTESTDVTILRPTERAA